MNINTLKSFLEKASIPSVKQQPKTFLEIARQPHYENVISNIYAFYFDPHEEHGLGHLFINSFIECIKEQLIEDKDFLDDFQDFIIDTESTTEKGGRIDLFLYNDEQAIIVENKIYHNLANDLEDYWKTAKKDNRKKENMVGVLLTLSKHTGTFHKDFVNVLHLDFLNRVMNNIGPYLMGASEKYVTFLKDLYQNIKNMSEKQLSEEDLRFYLEHADKIQQINDFQERAFEHIKSEVIKGANAKDGFSTLNARTGSTQWYNFRYLKKEGDSEVGNLMITIRFNHLLTKERKLEVYLEVQHDFVTLAKNSIIQEKLGKYEGWIKGIPKGESFWDYLAYKEFKLQEDDILNLSDFVFKALNEPKGGSIMDLFIELIPEFKRLKDH